MAADPPFLGWAPTAVINLNGTCTQLYFGANTIGKLGINPLELTLLATTLAFLLFLVIRIPCSCSRMNQKPNSIGVIYYTVVWVRIHASTCAIRFWRSKFLSNSALLTFFLCLGHHTTVLHTHLLDLVCMEGEIGWSRGNLGHNQHFVLGHRSFGFHLPLLEQHIQRQDTHQTSGHHHSSQYVPLCIAPSTSAFW